MASACLPFPCPRSRYFLWRHPEWWAISLSAGSWLLLIASAFGPSFFPRLHNAHLSHELPGPSGSHWPLIPPSYAGWSALALHWLLMIASMMFPTLIGQVRSIADRSFWSRRHRASAAFLAGYSATWLFFGLCTETILFGAQSSAPAFATYLVPVCFLVAALWQSSPEKRRSLVACHFTTALAASGWRAVYDCFLYGLRIGFSCCISCWALMLVCAASHHALWVVLVVTVVVWSERRQSRSRQFWCSPALFAAGILTLMAVR